MEVLSEYMQPNSAGFNIRIEHDEVKNLWEVMFQDKSVGKNLPVIKIKKNEISNGINILDLVLLTKLGSSKGEVRRMIKNNGLKINNELINDETKIFNQDNFDKDNSMKVSHGKKQHVIVKIT